MNAQLSTERTPTVATRTSGRDHSKFQEKMAVDWGLKSKSMKERSAKAAAKRAKKEEGAKIKVNQQAQKDARQRRGVAQLAEMKIQMELEDDEDEASFRKQPHARRRGASDDDYGDEDENDEDDEVVVDEEDGPANVPKKVRLRRRTHVLYVTHTCSHKTVSLSPLPHLHLQLSRKQKNSIKGAAITRAINEQAKNIRSNAPTATQYVSM